MPFNFESTGSQIIFYDQHQYNQSAISRRDYVHLRNQSDEEAKPLNRQRLTRLHAIETLKEEVV